MITKERLVKATFFGPLKSGKTSLIRQFRNQEFEQFTQPTLGADYVSIHREAVHFQLWDLSPPAVLKPRFAKTYLSNCEICVYALDLSAPLNQELFTADMRLIHSLDPHAKLVLVGTKADLERQIDDATFIKLQEDFNITHSVITSARSRENIKALFEKIADPKLRLGPNEKMLYIAIVQLESAISVLPASQQRLFNNAIHSFLQSLQTPHSNKALALLHFQTTCIDALALITKQQRCANLFLNLGKICLTLLGIVGVSLFVITLGFTLGLAIGTWAGPTAFLSAVISFEKATAVGIVAAGCSSGLGIGLILSHRFFGPSKLAPISSAVKQVSGLIDKDKLHSSTNLSQQTAAC